MFKHFFESLREIPSKNNGGCLFFCYVFLVWAKREGIDLSTFFIKQYDYDNKHAINTNIRFLNGQVNRSISSYHFTWLINGKEYDGYGPAVKYHLTNHVFYNSVNELEALCINALNFGV